MKKYIVILFIGFSTILAAQNSLAKIEYSYAVEAYSNNNYKKALEHLEEVKSLLGSTNARVMFLEILSKANKLEKYNTFSNSFIEDKKYIITLQKGINYTNSNKTFSIKAYENALNLVNNKDANHPFIKLINKLQKGEDLTIEDFPPDEKYTKAIKGIYVISNWLNTVDSINLLCGSYINNFENDVPLEKLKKIYDINKLYSKYCSKKELIQQSWDAINKKEYENALVKFKELDKAGIDSKSIISQLQKMI
ncbi:hypothetical protein R3X25_10565 [Lutibacter sp. TH_r2]|uniref:hypothetical protein n=1 Tax=Lutibacter sp. TH_r2 TaxID=3082083 RepID=UPI0029559772|nr:hypothetical protein [Lutibacter sp. TH_r2]MDV7187724.1 hypothetical protein [Lutibacter sp. TH_r2]